MSDNIVEVYESRIEADKAQDKIARLQMLGKAMDKETERLNKENRTLKENLAEAQADIIRLRGCIISQIQPEPYVLSRYSATSASMKNKEKDATIELLKEALECMKRCENCLNCTAGELNGVATSICELGLIEDGCGPVGIPCWKPQTVQVVAAFSVIERAKK